MQDYLPYNSLGPLRGFRLDGEERKRSREVRMSVNMPATHDRRAVPHRINISRVKWWVVGILHEAWPLTVPSVHEAEGRDGIGDFLETCYFLNGISSNKELAKSSENFARSRVLKLLAALFNIPFYQYLPYSCADVGRLTRRCVILISTS